jgi:serine/threonine protein kinase
VKSVFASALECDPRDRAAFLNAACGGDAEVRREIESLLASDNSLGDFIERPPPELKVLLSEHSTADEIGKRVGAYELVRELGSGGMGTVYLAMRADAAFRKYVAVKLIRKGMESDLVLNRFHKERRILAGLEHANIARLLDAGATARNTRTH